MRRRANQLEPLMSRRVGCAIFLLVVAVVVLFVFLIWHFAQPWENSE